MSATFHNSIHLAHTSKKKCSSDRYHWKLNVSKYPFCVVMLIMTMNAQCLISGIYEYDGDISIMPSKGCL